MVEEPFNSTIDTIVRVLKNSRSILFITGAGISADSGIPTYRGIGGLYDVDVTEEGYPIEEVLSASMFGERPELTWKYLLQIGEAVQGKTFNRGHEVIAEMESEFPRLWTLTQNIDGFHRAAGSKNVIEAHGSMQTLSCTKCSYKIEIENFTGIEIPPKCPDCKSLVRPDVVLFGELICGDSVQLMQDEVQKGFDLTFSIGTSSVFPYIQAPIQFAKSVGNPTVEINPSETSISHIVDYHLPMRAAEALDEIWKRFKA
ncbi:MAG: NAD-dependent deacylase [Mariniblastus sp.]